MVKTTSTKAVKTAPKKRTIKKPVRAAKNVTKPVISDEKSGGVSAFLHQHGHAVLSFVYAVQALLIILLAKTYSVSVTTTYIAKDSLGSSAAGETILAPASRHFMDVNVGYVVAGVLLVAAITHLLLAVIKKRDTWNTSTIMRHGRRVRWSGLTLSVAGLVAIIALLLGVRDITALAGLKALIIAAGIIGYLADEHQLISRRILLLLGGITALVPVVVLGLAAAYSSVYGELTGLTLGAASVVLLGLLILFLAFYYAAKAKKAATFSRSAFISIVLIIVESAAAWQIFAGFLR